MKKLHIWFIIGSIFLFVVSSVAFYMEHKKEWKEYQRQFRQIEYEKTKADYKMALKDFAEGGDKAKCQSLAEEVKGLSKTFDRKAYTKAVSTFKKARKIVDKIEKNLMFVKSKLAAAEYSLHKVKYPKALKKDVEDMKKEVSLFEAELAKATIILEEKEKKMASFTNPIKTKERQIAKIRNKYRLNWYESRLPEIRPGFLDSLRNFIFVDFLHSTNRINQVYLPGLGNRVDRCTTCHMAIDRPGLEKIAGVKKTPKLGFKNKGLPFTTHSEFEIIIKNHPPERFGCTICHQGQGRAIEDKAARGDVPHWEEPLLPAEYIESSCGKCHLGLGELEGAPKLSKGRQLFQEHK
ncbi:MAG: hypothetical protein AAB267_05860, partial [Candidatus Desantisbacteria bacterium]